MKSAHKAIFITLMAFLAAGCGSVFQPGPTPTPTQDPQNPVYNITLSDFAFTPDRIKLKVGQNVTFHVKNGSATDHEIMIGRNPLRNENGVLGDGFEQDFFALTEPKVTGDAQVMGMPGSDMNMDMSASSSEGDMAMETQAPGGEMGMAEMENGFMVMFDSEQEATINFTVTEDMQGAWTMGCFEVSQGLAHFDRGMVGNVIVQPE
jgi:plastocyanin